MHIEEQTKPISKNVHALQAHSYTFYFVMLLISLFSLLSFYFIFHNELFIKKLKNICIFPLFFYKFPTTIFMGAIMVRDNKNINCHFRGNGGKKF